jgi:mannose-6-phosphate isomerase-like protein (cupin superfamily)
MSGIASICPSSHCVAPVFVSWLCLVGAASGQTPPPRARPSSSSTMVFLHVRDASGHVLSGVRVQVAGTASGEFTTDGEGVARLPSMRDGAYHLRFERMGFTTQERDVTLRGGQPDVIDVALSPASAPEPTGARGPGRADAVLATPPAPAPSPRSPTPPPPAPGRAGTALPPVAGDQLPAAGEQKTVSIPTFLDRNLIGREPLKESILGCTATATTRLLQLRETLAEHVHANVDEMLYVVAGEGTLIIPGRAAAPIAPGSLSIVPRGAPHAIERRGKNPLIVLSILSGTPCSAETGAPR